MRLLKRLSPLVLIFLCACATGDHEPRFTEPPFTKGGGDLGEFLCRKAVEFGAKNVSTNDLPPIRASWKYFEDPDGVMFRLGPSQFREVQAMLRKAVGPPSKEPIETTDHGQLGWYAARVIGVGLQFRHNPKRTEIILLRPRKNLFERAAPPKN